MKILIFGGTTEGRQLATQLAELGYSLIVCVATEYGAFLLPDSTRIITKVGRLTADEMLTFMDKEKIQCVIDATHPYAVLVTKNIRWACSLAGLTYFRLKRDIGAKGQWLQAKDSAQAAKLLSQRKGNILLTTGSKELANFIELNNNEQKLYVRVLPSIDSLELCLKLGLPAMQLICMQGPFTVELNVALLRQYNIKTLVTKDTGNNGGFYEKVKAAKITGVRLLVINPPQAEQGYSQSELLDEIQLQYKCKEAN